MAQCAEYLCIFLCEISQKVADGAKRQKFSYFLLEIMLKILKETIKRENIEKIHRKQVKISIKHRNIDSLSLFSITKFLPCFLSSLMYSPGGALAKLLPL